jgi:hypothetical protein
MRAAAWGNTATVAELARLSADINAKDEVWRALAIAHGLDVCHCMRVAIARLSCMPFTKTASQQ